MEKRYKIKQEVQGPWRAAWRFARWNKHSFMDTGNVAKVTYLLIHKVPYTDTLKFGR